MAILFLGCPVAHGGVLGLLGLVTLAIGIFQQEKFRLRVYGMFLFLVRDNRAWTRDQCSI